MASGSSLARSVAITLKRITRLLLSSSTGFVFNSVILMAGSVLGQGLYVLGVPLLARIYTPETFGSAAPVLSVITILSVVACGRYELAILLPREEETAFSVLVVGLIVCSCVSILLVLGAWLFFTLESAHVNFWAIPIGVFSNGCYVALSYWTTRKRSFALLAIARVLNSLVTLGLQFFLGLIGNATKDGLIVGAIAGPAFAVVLLAFSLLGVRRQFIRIMLGRQMLLGVAKRYRRFPLIEAWGAFLNASGGQLPVFILGSFFSGTVVGYYVMAGRVIAAPIALLSGATAQVFFQRASELRRHGLGIYYLTRKIFFSLALLGLLPFLVITVGGRSIFAIFLGGQWAEAGLYAQYLAPGLFFQLTFSPLSTIFAILEKQRLGLLVHLLVFSVPLLALLVGIFLFQNSITNVMLVLGAGYMILYSGLSLWNLRIAKTSELVQKERVLE